LQNRSVMLSVDTPNENFIISFYDYIRYVILPSFTVTYC
jgi:hypothetical protein